jgi:lysophospholipase L1-like esterase
MRTSIAFAWMACTVLSACSSTPSGPDALRESRNWYAAWAASHSSRLTEPSMAGRTVRMILRPNIGGDGVRVKLENTFGQAPVVFSGAFIGLAGSGAEVRSNARLTFAGQARLTLAPGQGIYSDPVAIPLKAFDKLALSLEVESAADISSHDLGLRINWSVAGARGAQESADGFEPLQLIGKNPGTARRPFYWVAALDVHAPDTGGSIALLGDSITDGTCSSRDGQGKEQPDLYQRWGDVMAVRLAAKPPAEQRGIADVGIAGNRVLTPAKNRGMSALDRLERDVLDRTGITHLVLFEGTNDIGSAKASAPEIIAGQQQIIDKAHAKGIKIIGATIIPRGRPAPQTDWSGPQETQRLALNEWIRHRAAFDGVIDFDRLMQNGPVVVQADGSSAPSIPPEWNCGDSTHPNTAGYRAMGEFVDLQLFDGVHGR